MEVGIVTYTKSKETSLKLAIATRVTIVIYKFIPKLMDLAKYQAKSRSSLLPSFLDF